MTHRGLRMLCGSSVIVFAAACGGDSAVTPDARVAQPLAAAASNTRTLAIEFTTPSSSDAGMIFSIEGPNILGIAPAEGVELVSNRSESRGRTTLDVLVAGPLRSGVVAWLTVKGVNSGNPYEARISQVAAGASAGFVQRDDLAGYRLAVRR